MFNFHSGGSTADVLGNMDVHLTPRINCELREQSSRPDMHIGRGRNKDIRSKRYSFYDAIRIPCHPRQHHPIHSKQPLPLAGEVTEGNLV